MHENRFAYGEWRMRRSTGLDMLTNAATIAPRPRERTDPLATSPPGRKKLAARKTMARSAPVLPPEPEWTFFTNHAHVFLCIARDPDVRMRDVAALVGITERAVQRIVAELEDAGYIERIRNGRRNRYEVRTNLPLRHPIERHERVSSLIALVLGERERSSRSR